MRILKAFIDRLGCTISTGITAFKPKSYFWRYWALQCGLICVTFDYSGLTTDLALLLRDFCGWYSVIRCFQRFLPLYWWSNEEEHMNSTTEHCARIATASPQPHIKKKISKSSDFIANRPTVLWNPKHAITVFTKNRGTTALKCIKIRACAIITFIIGHLTGLSGACGSA